MLFEPHIGTFPTAMVLATLFVGAELMIARNYAVALLFITPLTIGMVMGGQPRALPDLLLDRAAETAVGVGIVAVLILTTHGLRHPRIARPSAG